MEYRNGESSGSIESNLVVKSTGLGNPLDFRNEGGIAGDVQIMFWAHHQHRNIEVKNDEFSLGLKFGNACETSK